MNSVPAPDSPAASRLRGVLRSWLQAWLPDASTPPEAPADEAAAAGVPAPASVRVLVVDDNPANLMLISAQMEAFGILPVLAADGAEAVALACELDFDLILMDLQMPILDGLGATSAIRRVEAAGSRAAVPVVAFAGTSPGPGMLAAHGISGSLIKPCDDQSLEECLVRWCPTYRAFAAGRQAALGDGLRAMARRNLGDSPGTPS